MRKKKVERTLVGMRVTVFPRGKKGVYHADFHFRGQHCRKSLKTNVKKVAIRRAFKIEQSLDEETYIPHPKSHPNSNPIVLLATAIGEFIAFSDAEGRRRRTIVKQRGILNRFESFAAENGIVEMVTVDLRLIDRFRSKRKETLSPKSMHNEGQLIKQFLAWCHERKMIDENPLSARKFRPPKYEPREGPSLQQINLILKVATPLRFPVIATLAFTGARSGEVSHLRVEDLDLAGNWLHYVSRKGFETKTGNNRKVPVHDRLRPILEKAIKGRKSGWLFNALPSRQHPKGDHHISTKHLNEDFVKLLKKLEITAGRTEMFQPQ